MTCWCCTSPVSFVLGGFLSQLAHQLSPWSTRRSNQSRPLQPTTKPCCLAQLFGPCLLELFFYLSLHSCCSWLVCKLSAWTLRQSFLRCVSDLANSTNVQFICAETFQLRKRSIFIYQNVHALKTTYVCALWMLKSTMSTVSYILHSHSASQLAELYLAVVHFGGSVRQHTKKLCKNCPLVRNEVR